MLTCAWLWIYAGAALMLLELVAPGFVLCFFGLSAATVGVLRFAFGEAFTPTWQLAADVHWGELDVMFVDMPPGTGDVPLTVFQSLPVDGVVIVTSPQDLVELIVSKSVKMAGMMKKPVIGLVENMSYLKCPDCGKEIAVFGESKAETLAKKFAIPETVRLPIDPSFASAIDVGAAETIEIPGFDAFADLILK